MVLPSNVLEERKLMLVKKTLNKGSVSVNVAIFNMSPIIV